MSDLTAIAARTQRFRNAVRAFTLPPQVRHAKLMPMKDSIVELRQKGTSLGVIRELLATVGVAVSTATIAQVLTKMSHNSASARRRQRFRSRTRFRSEHDPSASCRRIAGDLAMTGKSPQPPACRRTTKCSKPFLAERSIRTTNAGVVLGGP
jgi:hypothetical protein